jgi:hypothetical protein
MSRRDFRSFGYETDTSFTGIQCNISVENVYFGLAVPTPMSAGGLAITPEFRSGGGLRARPLTQFAGRMFALRRKKLAGSYFRLIDASFS